jgi:hypothetical protein
LNNSGLNLYESDVFTVSGATGAATVAASQASYTAQEPVVIDFTGLPGNSTDWVGIFTSGAADTAFSTYLYTGGQSAGQLSFTGLAPGTYTARAFANNGFERLGESATFTVTP